MEPWGKPWVKPQMELKKLKRTCALQLFRKDRNQQVKVRGTMCMNVYYYVNYYGYYVMACVMRFCMCVETGERTCE